MLCIELKVNYKTIRTIGVQNVSSTPVHQSFKGECPYDIWDLTGLDNIYKRKHIGEIRHLRSEGAEVLAQKALSIVIEHDKKKRK